MTKTNRIILQAPALGLCLLSASLVQAATPASGGALDKRLTPIADAAERHVEVPLMQAALARQAAHTNTPFEARWNAAGQVQVYLRIAKGSAGPGIQALQELGATDVVQSQELGIIQAWLPASSLKAAASLPGIARVALPRYALHRSAPAFGPVTQTGSVDTQGDTILGASQFRTQTAINGGGVTVGVISDGDQHISTSQASGDLPSNIWNDPKDTGGSGGFSAASTGDEGTAMMEIIYDLAPGVKQLGFCGPQTDVDFITCLDDFSSDIGANVIVDDLAFPGGAMFTTDTFTSGVQSFAAANPNIRLVAATGNDGTGFWQGTWQPITVNTTVNGITYTQAENFGSAGSPIPYLQINVSGAEPGDEIAYILEWDDPWDDTSTTNISDDYDVVVFDNQNSVSSGAAGQQAVACNQGINIGPASATGLCNQNNSQPTNTPGPTPVQGSEWQWPVKMPPTSTYYLEVLQQASGDGSPGANLKILVFDATNPFEMFVTPATPGSVYGHAALAAPTEISVGAIKATPALSGSYQIEPYSSEGPVETGVTPGPTTEVPKPDFTAPDCVSITGAGGFSNPFCGTSAAAPHIAGLLALMMQGYPSQSPYSMLQQAATQPNPAGSSGTPPFNGTFGYGVPILTSLLTAGKYPVPATVISAPADGTSVAIGQAVNFSGNCTADAAAAAGTIQFSWDFGAGSGVAGSTQSTPTETFNTAGTYAVTLTCTNSTGSGTASIKLTVLPSPPVASISAPTAGTAITAGQATAFSGICSGSGTMTYSWDFGTNSGVAASSQQDPSVAYKNAGNYTVTLTCTNSGGSNSASVNITVKAAPSKGGGGDMDLLSLLALGLLATRRHGTGLSRRR